MKVYSIGREYGCDIVIDDNTDVISRRHATLNVSPSGKMTIVDMSHNGTYVNGIRISPNVPVPVTRKDNISFAHVARLDWERIPNTQATILRYVLLGVLAVVLVVGGLIGFKSLGSSNESAAPQKPSVAAVDSTELKKQEEKMKEKERERQDSIKKAVQDSLNKVKQGSKGQKTKKADASKKKDNDQKSKAQKNDEKQKADAQQENRQRRFH